MTKIDVTDDGSRISVDAAFRWKDALKALPGSRWDRDTRAWTLPLSWSSCLILRSTFGEDLEIGDRLIEWASKRHSEVIAPATAAREVLEAEGDGDLYPHQRAGVLYLDIVDGAIIGDEPGAGKTAQAIRSLRKKHEAGQQVFPALVVCPNSVKQTWAREFEKFWPMSEGGPDVSVIKGTPAKKAKIFAAVHEAMEHPTEHAPQVLVINWEGLRSHSRLAPYGSVALKRCEACGGEDGKVTPARCHVHPRELNDIDFKAVIGDEIHRAKDPAAQQSRALLAATGDAKIRIALSGTLISKDPTEFWSTLHWIDPVEWPTKSKWVDRYVDFTYNAFGGMVVTGIKPHMVDEFHATTGYRMRRMLKKVVLPFLPEVVPIRRECDMLPAQKRAYDAMLEDMIAKLDSGELLVATNPMVQTLRLLQFASAHGEILTTVTPGVTEYGDDDEVIKTSMLLSEPSGKLDAFMDDVTMGDFGDQSVVVFAQSRQLVDLLSARMEKAKIAHGRITGSEDEDQRQRAMDDFQAGKTQYILCTLGAGSTGITLTKASVRVFLQRSWSPIEMEQAYNRTHRIGSEIHESITHIDYVTTDTVEESVIRSLEVKGEHFEAIVRDKDMLAKWLKGEIL